MSRIIHTESNISLRKKSLEGIAAALRYASVASIDPHEMQDILAFLVLSLKVIHDVNEQAIAAWEKRGYWIKAERFRMQWYWVQKGIRELETGLDEDNSSACAAAAAGLAQHLTDIRLSHRANGAKPWANAWKAWKQNA